MVKYEMGGYSDKMTFFKYYFIETVPFGNGNFGIVLKSKCKTENVEYAIKINKMSVSSQHQKDELYKEVQMLQICQGHKNVIKLYNSFEQCGKIYQQLEFCSKTLWDIVYKLEFIPNDLLHSYIIDMLDGTAYIHSLNIIHMDLKLENILVSSQNICKIADFGLSISSIRAQQTEDDDIEDLMYHRMEILGETPTTAVDIFALGLLILELVTDIDIPSNGRQFNKLRKKIIPKKLKHNVSKCIVHLINNMICVDKDERLSAVNLLKQMNQTK
uniref:Protein kinase domain-containing protein n=1 Tax=Rhabditophanes sp. KR3021 TaxID=114890 RepID=A0AC35TKI4_9BILA